MTRPTLGLLAPFLPTAAPLRDVAAVRSALRSKFVDAVWVRDLPVVPVGDLDIGQFDDPFAYLARVGSPTGVNPTVGTASLILGVRHPLVIARAAAAAQATTEGRFILGLGSGGKPAMNEALGVSDRSEDVFARRWRAVRDSLDGHLRCDVDLPLTTPWTPPPMYLASARQSHWSSIDGDADGWMAFLEPWSDLERNLSAISSTRSGTPPPTALRVDLSLEHSTPWLAERGRLHCSPAHLAEVFHRLSDYPVTHLMLRIVSQDPRTDLTTVRSVWDDT